jgi:large subunit ribosomal protein L25
MSEPTLMAEPRSVVGKKVKRLRKEGRIPAVVYGPTLSETVQVTVDEREFSRFFSHHGHATLFSLHCDSSEYSVFIREVQIDPVRWNAIHVDFFAPNLKKVTTASVPLSLHDAPDGPGIFNTQLSEVNVRALPASIPNSIVVDCSGLTQIGDTIRVADLPAMDGVEFLTGEDEIIAMLSAPVEEREPVEDDMVEDEAAPEIEDTGAAATSDEPAEANE